MKVLPYLSLAGILLLAALSSAAPARADAFEDANRAFAAGQYAESARGYEAVLKQNGYAAPVLFDLGNADLRLGKTGEAILNYERAKWLAPHDPDINANLRFAQRQAGLPAPAESWLDGVADLCSPNDWAWLASGSLVLLCAGILGGRSRSKYRQSFRGLSTVSALILVAAGASIAARDQQLDRAILPAKVTPALISPFAAARTAVEFSAGQTVNVEKAHGGFDFVRDAAGRSGWVNNGQVARLVPASS